MNADNIQNKNIMMDTMKDTNSIFQNKNQHLKYTT